MEQETKEYFGDKMYATLKEIKESRERALVIDSGNPYQNKTSLRKTSYYYMVVLSQFCLYQRLMIFQRHPIHLVLVLLSYPNVVVQTVFLH